MALTQRNLVVSTVDEQIMDSLCEGDTVYCIATGTHRVIGKTRASSPSSFEDMEALSGDEGNVQGSYGITSARPADVGTGFLYFDTTLGKPIWWDEVEWVDATGVAV